METARQARLRSSQVPALTLLVVAVLAADAAAQEPALDLFPSGRLYEVYLADPREPRFGLTVIGVHSVGVPESGASRFGLHLGGELGLLRGKRSPVGPWQLGFMAGFRGQFDRTHSSDNIGWDGIYGLMLSARPRPNLAVRAGLLHTSSHIGDEYAERTGRGRIGYTREEALIGIGLTRGRWRLYGESGWSFVARIPAQEPLRLQAGVEHRAPLGRLLGELDDEGADRFGWYAAVDLSSFQERGWRLDVGVAAGLQLTNADRAWRVGLALHDGRVPMGEHAEHSEQWLELGLWMDL